MATGMVERFAADRKQPKSTGAISKFAANVLSVLDRTECRRIEGGEDLEAIYELRYDAYHRSGMVPDSPSQTVADTLDELPNCYRFGVYIDGRLASTIRFHVLSSAHPFSNSMALYPDVLGPRVEAGQTFIDPTRFASNLEMSRLYPALPYLTLRIAVMAVGHFQTDYCLSLVQSHHVAFYKRIFGAVPAGDVRHFEGTINCAVRLYESSRREKFARTLMNYPFFRSSAAEKRMLFDRPCIGLDAPLTVLPTARLQKEAA